MKNRLLNKTARALLQHPVTVRVYPGDGVNELWAGYHILKRGVHRIHVGASPARGFHNVLAHEMAHALCDEAYPDADSHGVEFAVAALIIRDLWTGWGIPLTDVYDPDIDE
jgi:hypothetical protein